MAMLALRPPPRRVAQPKADPRFVAVSEQIKRGAAQLKKHPPAAQKAREASRSAKAPANERLAAAKAKVVDKVQEAPTPKPQPTSFKALLRAEIEKAMPKTLGDTEKFMEGGQSGALKGALGSNVASQKESAAGPVEQATQQVPNPGSVPATLSAALPAEPAPPRPAVNGAAAMPPPATPAEASLEQSKKDTSEALKEEKIKPESLAKANDPRFSAVAAAQNAVVAQASKAPAGFRAREAAMLAGARAQAGGQAARGSLLLAGTRAGGNAKVLSRQQQQAAKEEADRQKVAADIEGIFSQTKARVESRLSGLDGEVSALFDPGVEAALATMKSYVDDRIFKYKLERYLSIPGVGLARWLRDQALGLPEEVNAFYVKGRQVFQAAMDRLIDRVAGLVELRLAQAKADVAAGQAQIKAYVARLPANLKATGDAAAKAVGDRFNELSASIDAKKEELASSLAQKYKEAFDKADEALKAMQDENKGLLQQFAEKLGEVVKALLEFKAKLMAILRKGQDAIQLILDDPIAFLGNLIAAVKGGFNAFVGNILTHLKAGFIKWLFGSLAAAGIALPSDLSLPSIFKLVLDVLGITYDKMRAKAVRLIGERAVGMIEKAVEYVREFVTGGPAKLWEKVKEDLANLKDMVIGAIQDWLITTIVKQAVAKVVSMFNPAGAIVQAIMAIYNVIMFVVEKAQQIMALVEAVVNSVHAIASGAIGGAISWIEKSLASAIPIVIGFLARLIGLGGISEKIKEFIKKVQAKVDAAIDKAIAKVVAMVKKLFGAAKAGVRKLLNWWKKMAPIDAAGERHTLLFNGKGSGARFVIRSTEMDPLAFLAERKSKMKPAGMTAKQKENYDAGVKELAGATGKVTEIKKLQTELAAFDDDKKPAPAGDASKQAEAKMSKLDSLLTDLAATITKIIKLFRIDDPTVKKLDIPSRRSWEIRTKVKIAEDYMKTAEYRKSDLVLPTTPEKLDGKTVTTPFNLNTKRKNAAGVAETLGRRHIVSSGDMRDHYVSKLKNKKASEGKLLLEQRASIGDARTAVKGDLDEKSIGEAARERHAKFFNYASNLWIGPQRENSVLQQKIDANKPGMKGNQAAIDEHVAHIKRGWAMDGDFTPTPVA